MRKNLIDEAFSLKENDSPDASCLKEELLFFYAVYLIKSGKVGTAYPRILDNQLQLMIVCMLSYLRNKNEDENLFAVFKQWQEHPYISPWRPIYIHPIKLTQYRAYWECDEMKRFNFENMNLDLSSYSLVKIVTMIEESQVLAKYAKMVKESVSEIIVGGFYIFYNALDFVEDGIVCCPEGICPNWMKFCYRRI